MTKSKSSILKKVIGVTAIIFYCFVYDDVLSKINVVKRNLKHFAVEGEDVEVKGKCFVIETTMKGVTQWGNGMYYYMSAVMYLLKKGATYVIVPTVELGGQPRNPIGAVNLDGVAYGPNASSVNESRCIKADPRQIWTGMWGTMWDFMKFREQWDDMVKDWPGAPYNLNPFISDFGVYPTLSNITSRVGVDWDEVLVMHIRQGDVMWQINGPANVFWHSQPPCGYYEDVIETGYEGGPFPYLLIITNKIPGRNPNLINICDQYLDDKYSSGKHYTKILNYELIADRLYTVKSHAGEPDENIGLRKDLYILTEAVNVAEGHSTFTMGTTMFNHKLKRHFFAAAPASINTVLPTKVTIDGLIVQNRQFYLPGVQQTLYILNDWLGFDGSCEAYEPNINGPLMGWMSSASEQAKSWKSEKTNYTEKLLNYDPVLMTKFITSNEPFRCDSVSSMTDNPSWYIPCVCKNPNSTALE